MLKSLRTPRWILWEHWLKRTQCGRIHSARFVLEDRKRLGANRHTDSQSAHGALVSLLLLSHFVSVCACASIPSVYMARARCNPPTHTISDTIKLRPWAISFQSLPSFALAHSRLKPRWAPAGSSEHWWNRGWWMLREVVWSTGESAQGHSRWWSPCRTWSWPPAW